MRVVPAPLHFFVAFLLEIVFCYIRLREYNNN